MKTLIHIITQYFENGRPKGMVMFSINADSDHFMYAENQCIESIKTLLVKQSNDYVKYEYVSHELIFHGITPLDDAEFEAELLVQAEKTFGK